MSRCTFLESEKKEKKSINPIMWQTESKQMEEHVTAITAGLNIPGNKKKTTTNK